MLMVTLVAACRHGEPFAPDAVADRGPFSAALPRRLTFDPANDLLGGVVNGTLTFTSHTRSGDGCIATMPSAGGVRTRVACPDTLTSDVHQWLLPTPSPDGARLAFIREVIPFPGATVVRSRELVATAADGRANGMVLVSGSFVDADGARVNAFRQLTWMDPTRLRFVGDTQSFGTLGTKAPVAVYEVDVTTGVLIRIPGPPPLAWVAATGGGAWEVPLTDPAGLYRVAVDGTRTRVATIDGAASDLADVGGQPVVLEVIPPPSPQGVPAPRLSLYDAATGAFIGALPQPGVPEAIRAVPGSRWAVVQFRAAAGADLWLVAVP